MSRVGIDAGASLWKLARVGESLDLELLPVGAVEEVRRRVQGWEPEQIQVTGGGSALEGNPALQEVLRRTVEMSGREAWILPGGAFCGAVGAALS